jgi:aminoacrylate hydrolase
MAYQDSGAEGLASSYRCLVDLARRSEEIQPQQAWRGSTLVIEAEDDPLVTQAHSGRLKALHPDCDVRTFPAGGHSLLVSRPQDYVATVLEFVERTGP